MSRRNKNSAANKGGPLASHPLEMNPEHRVFLIRSLDRCDTEFAALVKLNRLLTKLKREIMEYCHGSESLLLDLGDGSIRLNATGDGLEGRDITHDAQKLCYDFLCHRKLRRQLLNRLSRRLQRLAHSLDGKDIAPPLPPKYGDIRMVIDSEAISKFRNELKEKEAAKERIRLKLEEKEKKDEEEAKRIADEEESKTKGDVSEENKPKADENEDETGKEDVEMTDAAGEEDNDNTAKASEDAPAPLETTSDKAVSAPSKDTDPAVVASSNAEHATENMISDDTILEGKTPSDAKSSDTASPLLDPDHSVIREFNSAYDKTVNLTTGETSYNLLDTPPPDTIPTSVGVGGRHMTPQEKEAELKRWQNSVLMKIPDQPTRKELGFENRVFNLEERRRIAKEKGEEAKRKMISKGDSSEESESEEAKKELHNSDDEEEKDDKVKKKKKSNEEESATSDNDDDAEKAGTNDKEVKNKENDDSKDDEKSATSDDVSMVDDDEDDKDEKVETKDEGDKEVKDEEKNDLKDDEKSATSDKMSMDDDDDNDDEKAKAKDKGNKKLKDEEKNDSKEEDKRGTSDNDSMDDDDDDKKAEANEGIKEEEGTEIENGDDKQVEEKGSSEDKKNDTNVTSTTEEKDEGSEADDVNKKSLDLEQPPKRIKPMSLAPFPSFYNQDLRRIKLLHADLMATSLHHHARRRIAEVTHDYNRAYQNSLDICVKRNKFQNELNQLSHMHRRDLEKLQNDYAMQVSMARNQYQKRKETWELQNAKKHSMYAPIGTPRTTQAARHPNHVYNNVGVALGRVIDAVVMKFEGNSDSFEPFVPPPAPNFDTIVVGNGETLSQRAQRIEVAGRRDLQTLNASLSQAEDDRRRAWRKLCKTKSEFELPAGRARADAPLPPLRANNPVSTPAASIAAPVILAPQQPKQTVAAAPYTMINSASSSQTPMTSIHPTGGHWDPSNSANTPVNKYMLNSQSKYSAAKVRERIASDGTVKPVTLPKRDKDGLFMRPAGRTRKGMSWDAIRGMWVPHH